MASFILKGLKAWLPMMASTVYEREISLVTSRLVFTASRLSRNSLMRRKIKSNLRSQGLSGMEYLSSGSVYRLLYSLRNTPGTNPRVVTP